MNPFEDEENETNMTGIKTQKDKIEIWVAIDHGRKNTYISGLVYDEANMKEYIKNLKKKHGCNGTLKKVEDKFIIQLQGDHIDNICDYFEELGIKDIIIKGE